jgi:hypothetical protein
MDAILLLAILYLIINTSFLNFFVIVLASSKKIR